MLTLPVFAAEEEEEEDDEGELTANNSNDVRFSDFWHPSEAKGEVADSEFQDPIDKLSNWGTYGLILVIAGYFGIMCLLMFSPNPKHQSRGFFGILIGVGAIIWFTCGTSTAFDFLNG